MFMPADGSLMWDKLIQYFNGRKFLPVDLHMEGMCLFYIAEGQSASLVWILRDFALAGMTQEQYENYRKTIQDVFFKQNYTYVQVLTLFLCSDVARVKTLAEGSMYWIADETYGRLIVFENQPEDFLGLRTMLENNLVFGGDSRNSSGAQKNAYHNNFSEQYRTAYDEKKQEKKAFRRQGWKNRKQEMTSGYQRLAEYSWVTYGLIAVNILIFLLTDLFQWDELLEKGCLYWYYVFEKHEYYRAFTCMFLHGDIGHISSNMLALFAVGDIVERDLGHIRYILLYLISGLFASATSVFYYHVRGEYTSSIGASGAIYGVAGALLVMFLTNPYLRRQENMIRMGIFVLFLFYPMFIGSEGIDYAAHLGGFIAGGLFYWIQHLLSRRRQKRWSEKIR